MSYDLLIKGGGIYDGSGLPSYMGDVGIKGGRVWGQQGSVSGSGRRQDWVVGRRLLVYIARSWSEMTTGEIGKRLGRDPSMISRLYRDYEGKRDRQREKRLSRLLSRRVQTHV